MLGDVVLGVSEIRNVHNLFMPGACMWVLAQWSTVRDAKP